MSLMTIKSVENLFNYAEWGGYWNPDPGYVWDKYNQYLHTDPRHYAEELSNVMGFYWTCEPNDCFYLWTMLTISVWPGWAIRRYKFDAGSCALLETTEITLWNVVYITSIALADLNHIYVTHNSSMGANQVANDTLADQSNLWSFNPWDWGANRRHFSHLVVNRASDTILGDNYPYLEVWTDVRNNPTILFSQRIGDTVMNMAYESNNYAWILTTTGQILKVAWDEKPRVEMFSSIQNPDPTDRGRWLAYDAGRKRIAVFRWKPNLEDGTAQNCIDFYNTVPRPSILTAPVPVQTCKISNLTTFVANVVGDMGEAFVGAFGTPSLVAPNNHGKIISASPISDTYGSLAVTYQAPAEGCTETLKLDVDYVETISNDVR